MSTIPETLQAGLKHHRAGQLAEAERLYRRILQMHPRHAGAVHLLGLIAFQVGKIEIAELHLVEAIKIDAFQAAFPADLAEIYRAQGKFDAAIAAYRKSLELNPKVAAAHYHFGTLLASQGQAAEAVECFCRAVQLEPGHAPAHTELGRIAQQEGRLAEAQAAFEIAVQATPDDPQAYLRLGICLAGQGQWHAAIACYEKALRLRPDWPEAGYRLGKARLALGDFANGWRDYQWRIRCPGQMRHVYSQPVWNGAPLAGRSLIVQAPTSLSDTLQFIRYVPLAAARGADVRLDVPNELVPLLAESGFTSFVTADTQGESELQAPLIMLPYIFGTTPQTIPATVPYLSADKQAVGRWRERISTIDGFRVGIAWQGKASRPFDRLRSIPLPAFEPLAHVEGVRLVSLEQGDGLGQLPRRASVLTSWSWRRTSIWPEHSSTRRRSSRTLTW